MFIIGSYNFYARNYIEVIEFISDLRGKPWAGRIHAFYVEGKTLVLRKKKHYPITRRDVFEVGDEIYTGKNGFLIIRFGYDSQIKILEDSKLKITDTLINEKELFKSPKEFSFELVQGAIFNSIHNAQDKFVIRSKSNKITVEGTEFFIKAEDNHMIKVAVLHGKVLVTNKRGQTLIAKSKGISIEKNGPILQPKTHAWVKDIKWKKVVSNIKIDFLESKIARIKNKRSYTISSLVEKIKGSPDKKQKHVQNIIKKSPPSGISKAKKNLTKPSKKIKTISKSPPKKKRKHKTSVSKNKRPPLKEKITNPKKHLKRKSLKKHIAKQKANPTKYQNYPNQNKKPRKKTKPKLNNQQVKKEDFKKTNHHLSKKAPATAPVKEPKNKKRVGRRVPLPGAITNVNQVIKDKKQNNKFSGFDTRRRRKNNKYPETNSNSRNVSSGKQSNSLMDDSSSNQFKKGNFNNSPKGANQQKPGNFNQKPGKFNQRPGKFNQRPGNVNQRPKNLNPKPGNFNQ